MLVARWKLLTFYSLTLLTFSLSIGPNSVNLLPFIIAFQFFEIGTAYLARNIFDGNSGELDNYLPFSVLYVSGS